MKYCFFFFLCSFIFACESTNSDVIPELPLEETVLYTLSSIESIDDNEIISLAFNQDDALFFTSMSNNKVSKADKEYNLTEVNDVHEVFKKTSASRVFVGGSDEVFALSTFQPNSDLFYTYAGNEGFSKTPNPFSQEDQPYALTSFVTIYKDNRLLVLNDDNIYELKDGQATKLFEDFSEFNVSGNQFMGNTLAYDGDKRIYFIAGNFAAIPDHSSLGYIDLEKGVQYFVTPRLPGTLDPAYNFGDGEIADAFIGNIEALTCDKKGNLYFVESITLFGPKRLRKLSSNGILTTLAGGSLEQGQDGTGEEAGFDSVYGMAINSSGEIYIATSSGLKLARVAS